MPDRIVATSVCTQSQARCRSLQAYRGAGKFSRKTLGYLGRGVYSTVLPAHAVASDKKYYVQIITDSDEKLQSPPTAPAMVEIKKGFSAKTK